MKAEGKLSVAALLCAYCFCKPGKAFTQATPPLELSVDLSCRLEREDAPCLF